MQLWKRWNLTTWSESNQTDLALLCLMAGKDLKSIKQESEKRRSAGINPCSGTADRVHRTYVDERAKIGLT